MDILFDMLVKHLASDYEQEIVDLFLLAFAAALISWALVEPIMMAIFANKKLVDRWKPVGFFTVNTLFLLLIGETMLVEGRTDVPAYLANILIISSLSSAIYGSLPRVSSALARAANRYAEGSKLDQKLNGDSHEDSHEDSSEE